MASPLDCSVCMNPYDLVSERQPMSLLCGHTLCCDCISRFSQKVCPFCKLAFTSHVPNFSLRDVMSTAASTPEALQRKKKEDDRIEVVTNRIAALRAEIKSRDSAIAKAHRKTAAAHEEIKELASQLPFNSSPSPLSAKQPVSSEPAGKQAINSNKPSSSDSPLEVILVDSDNLGNVLNTMIMSSSPAIYDFQGQDMKYTDKGDPTITSAGVVWKNGKIILTSKQMLRVNCGGVVMESMFVLKGCCGIMIEGDGHLTISACEITDCEVGLVVHSGALVAKDLKIIDCTDECIVLSGSSTASVDGCQLSGSGIAAIKMTDDSSMEGTGITITGAKTYVLLLRDSSALSLTECKMIRNIGTISKLEDKSSLRLLRCAIDGEFKKGDDAKLEIKR